MFKSSNRPVLGQLLLRRRGEARTGEVRGAHLHSLSSSAAAAAAAAEMLEAKCFCHVKHERTLQSSVVSATFRRLQWHFATFSQTRRTLGTRAAAISPTKYRRAVDVDTGLQANPTLTLTLTATSTLTFVNKFNCGRVDSSSSSSSSGLLLTEYRCFLNTMPARSFLDVQYYRPRRGR